MGAQLTLQDCRHVPMEKPIWNCEGGYKTRLVEFGKQWDGREADKVLGSVPFEDFGLPCTTEEFISKITPMFSDQPSVAAGKAAGMEAAAVPFLPKQCHIYASADEVINSLLDLRPEKWGLLAFQDWIKGTLVLEKLGILGVMANSP
ncbi:hypothetical protein SAY86_007671 [Trapa natans]|uniref:Uncharacterized protein n=1 Tax=Trapa natans TaxID=22666 RepID=A0AAN7LBB2_TRANT|nr:hypothetical protein SAY86_007671 [Trapa natans]